MKDEKYLYLMRLQDVDFYNLSYSSTVQPFALTV